MKFLHINATMRPEFGGPVHWIANAGRLLQDAGHESVTLTCDSPTDPSLQGWGVPVFGVGSSGLLGGRLAMGRWVEEHGSKFDVVILHHLWDISHPIVWRAIRRKGLRSWVFPHGVLDPWFNSFPLKKLKKQLYWPWALKASLRDSEATLFTTEEEKLLARQSFSPYQPNEVVISYGIPRPSFDPESARSAFQSALPSLGGRPYLLYLSRIHPKKGCDLLVKALASAPPETHLVMAGPDDAHMRPSLEVLAREAGTLERIHWPGMLKGDAKWGALEGCQAFILPSHQENFGQAVAEAMAVGRPVLITNKVNIHREVSTFSAGLVESDDLDGTQKAIRRFFSLSSEERRAMGEQGKACFEQRFDISRSVADILRLAENPSAMTERFRG